jgi:hypothetical protein
VIAANDTLTIVGNGDTIQWSTASGTLAFRLFDVASGASLTLGSLTVQNGLAQGNGSGASSAEGGVIYSQGTLALNSVTVQNNTAQGSFEGNAAGGGIYSGGALAVQGSTIQNNQALGTAQRDQGSTDFIRRATPGWQACGDASVCSECARSGLGRRKGQPRSGQRRCLDPVRCIGRG